MNKKQRAEYMKAWRLQNAERIRIYNLENKERRAATFKDWRERNPERFKELCKKWMSENRSRIKVYMQKYRQEHRDHRDPAKRYKYNHSPKQTARMRLRNARKSGKVMRPEHCSKCGLVCIPEGHHPDYSKPLEVVWLCRICHGAIHSKPSPSVRLTS